ncbi:putative ABC transporter permease [Bacillus sp. ISL-75]|uniref:putative ABC transporter permease n=1 Tax=Bacillus sp. ISL-75 TaxID=2819137 RepID=UPI001BE90F60|nr:putative ABC transporter permease [Bacillus sp. ISL-75]MBT2729655.1 putative ABC transporter permease [Bacillus sp. ISL-75]
MIINLLNGIEFQNHHIFNLEGAATIVFYFTVYSWFGWLLENSYNFFTKREFFKPNFLFGPFKPMYGFTPVLLVYLISPQTNLTVVILLCILIPTLVEYLTGALLQKLFNRQWWDYSDSPLQLHGHICLPFSACWSILSLLCIKWIHPAVASIYGAIDPYWAWVWSAVGLYFLADLVLAIRKHSLQDLFTDESTNPIQ